MVEVFGATKSRASHVRVISVVMGHAAGQNRNTFCRRFAVETRPQHGLHFLALVAVEQRFGAFLSTRTFLLLGCSRTF